MLNDITLYGFYNVYPEILTDLDLPEGLDEEMVRYTILDNAGMLVPYHQVMPQLSNSIHFWFRQNKDNFTRILAAINAEYNPIENYDRMEERLQDRTENRTENRTEDKTGKTVDSSSSSANSNTSTNASSSTLSQRAADNSETFRNVNQEIGSANSGGNSSTNSSGNSTQDITEGLKEGIQGGTTENIVESLRVHGNIGVMTNQMMVSAELELRRYNIYEDIANRFVDKFLLGVYD